MLARVLVIGAFVAAAVVVYALVDVAITPATRIRGLSKPLWFVVILVFLPIGALLWFFLGKVREGRSPKSSPTPPPTPVVDRGSMTPKNSDETVDERIARLEEELRKLDDEGDVPPKGTE
jgi:hypothetical protein